MERASGWDPSGSALTRRGALRVLLDTGPLFALLYNRDGKHSAAVAALEELEDANAEVSCAYPAALETHRLMLTREVVTVSHAHALINDALDIFTLTMPTLEDATEAAKNLKRFSDQKITLTDATIAAMARRERQVVFTFDERQRHFQLMGAAVYGDSGP